MSEPEKPKRRWLRLSTPSIVAASIIAYGLIWKSSIDYLVTDTYCSGWPCEAFCRHVLSTDWEIDGLLIDLLIGTLICLYIGFLIEHFIIFELGDEFIKNWPKLSFRNFDLSTLSLASLTFGLILSLNTRPFSNTGVDAFGWPKICVLRFKNLVGNPELTNIGNYQYLILQNQVILDLSTGLLMFLLSWTTWGYIIRRREGRKP